MPYQTVDQISIESLPIRKRYLRCQQEDVLGFKKCKHTEVRGIPNTDLNNSYRGNEAVDAATKPITNSRYQIGWASHNIAQTELTQTSQAESGWSPPGRFSYNPQETDTEPDTKKRSCYPPSGIYNLIQFSSPTDGWPSSSQSSSNSCNYFTLSISTNAISNSSASSSNSSSTNSGCDNSAATTSGRYPFYTDPVRAGVIRHSSNPSKCIAHYFLPK